MENRHTGYMKADGVSTKMYQGRLGARGGRNHMVGEGSDGTG